MRWLLKNPGERKPANLSVKNQADGEAHVYVYDIIGEDWYGGVSAKDFAAQILALDASTIHLHVNSPGGSVFEARSMIAVLNSYPAKTIAHIDGIAASAASWLALACDEVEINKGAFIMIHNSTACAYGNAIEMRSTADWLDKIDETIVADYTAATGESAETVKAWMDAETWFTSDEAIEHGFADRIAPEKAAPPSDSWNLAAYKNPPQTLTETAANTVAADDGADDRERRVRLIEIGC